jgi:hypothetical protein
MMRNVLFVLALGLAAGVQFTHQLFPTFTVGGPVHDLTDGLDSEGYAPPSRPATWLPESSTGEPLPAHSACVEGVPVSTTAVPRRELGQADSFFISLPNARAKCAPFNTSNLLERY